MRRQSLFSKERLVYWPEEFSEVVDLLNGRDREGRPVGNPLYSFNTGAIVLAASLGAKQKRRREVGARRKEISTATFASHNLEAYLFLVPLLGDSQLGTDFLRPENEEQVLREFEQYAAGGLEVLAGEMDASAGKAADVLVQSLMLASLGGSIARPGLLPDLL
jgi:dnd system-associated protein 4